MASAWGGVRPHAGENAWLPLADAQLNVNALVNWRMQRQLWPGPYLLSCPILNNICFARSRFNEHKTLLKLLVTPNTGLEMKAAFKHRLGRLRWNSYDVERESLVNLFYVRKKRERDYVRKRVGEVHRFLSCVEKRERESVCVRERRRESVCVWERRRESVFVRTRERKRAREWVFWLNISTRC